MFFTRFDSNILIFNCYEIPFPLHLSTWIKNIICDLKLVLCQRYECFCFLFWLYRKWLNKNCWQFLLEWICYICKVNVVFKCGQIKFERSTTVVLLNVLFIFLFCEAFKSILCIRRILLDEWLIGTSLWFSV